MTYTALELLFDKRLVERADPDSGELRQVEAGYILPGATIELDDARAELLLAVGAVALAPAAEPPAVEPEPEPEPDPEP